MGMSETHSFPIGESIGVHGTRECSCEPRRVAVPAGGVASGRGRRQGYRYDVKYIHNPIKTEES
jgi:hypothetical protein